MKTLSNLTPVEIFLLVASALIVWSVLKRLYCWIKKREQKVKKKFQIKVFVNDDVVLFERDDIKKWSSYDDNLIKITKANGDKVWFQGFPFVVDTFVTASE